MPLARIPRAVTKINTILENDSTWDKRNTVIDYTVQAAHMEEINVLVSGLNSDGIRGNGFNL